MPRRSHASWLSALPWIAAAIALAPLLQGFPDGHDWSIELVRTAEFGHAIEGGQLLPAWAVNLYGGYGSPIFLYFPPLYSAVSWLFGELSGSIPTGSTLAIAMAGLLGVAGMMRVGRLAAGGDGTEAREAGRIAACLFVLHPYLIADALLRNANSEYFALCLAPVAIAGLLDIRRNPSRGLLGLSGGLGLVILSHRHTALWLAGTIVVLAVVLYGPRRGEIRTAGAGFGLGLALAMFFWMPTLWLVSRVSPAEALGASFDFRDHFPAPSEIFSYGPFFAAGLVPLIVLGIAVAFARRGVPQQRLLTTLLIGSGVAIVLMLSVTTPVWEVVPGFELFQFPWRFQGPLALFAAVSGAIVYSAWARERPHAQRRGMQLAVLLFAALNALPHLSDARPLEQQAQDRLDERLTAASVREGLTATVADPYLPRGADAAAWVDQPLQDGGVVAVEGSAEIQVVEDSGTSLRLRISNPREASVTLGRWVFPGWSLRVNGETQELVANEFGSVDVPLPAGEHDVELTFRAPAVRTGALGVSAAALVVWLALFYRHRRSLRTGAATGRSPAAKDPPPSGGTPQ